MVSFCSWALVRKWPGRFSFYPLHRHRQLNNQPLWNEILIIPAIKNIAHRIAKNLVPLDFPLYHPPSYICWNGSKDEEHASSNDTNTYSRAPIQ